MSIPKKIHYCWFGGGALPESAKQCIASWEKHCPDYEIVEWNESNFDLDRCAYVREAYAAQKWAFVSDVARLHALVEQGGIYMDTDVELIAGLDQFLDCQAVSGFEAVDRVPTGLMACEKGHPFFAQLLRDYDDAHFLRGDGSYDMTSNVERITAKCLASGLRLDNTLQTVVGFTLYPTDYFCPKDYETLECRITENTCAIHHFAGSWLSAEDREALELKRKLRRRMPRLLASAVARFVTAARRYGVGQAIVQTAKRAARRMK